MAKKKSSARRRRINLSKLNPRRLLLYGAIVGAAVAILLGGVHHFAPQGTRDKIEGVTLDIIDLVRESRSTPPELVFWLDLVADHIPLSRGNVVQPGTALESTEESKLALGGKPATAKALTMLRNTGYLAAYDEDYKNPAWVAYRLFPPRHPPSPRPEGFEMDKRTRSRIESAAYSHSDYDRGHMAPNRAISLCYGREAQRETFLMSNVVPQKHGLNGAFWSAMERRVMDRYTRRYGDVWVICGPVYEGTKAKHSLKTGVAVPDAFFLIIAEKSEGGIRAEAFLVPHRDIKTTADPSQFLVSIRDIERRTGLDFFPALPGDVQNALETKPARRAW
ncbi:MAG: DNA/RNA non-specific endonuclease [Puniceicoccales bacterium]|jgi:endonuclease G|nr:DNA/RNA non-specific endonuclease [Puniceicoccales bacterium]